jgi:hypothetical protein
LKSPRKGQAASAPAYDGTRPGLPSFCLSLLCRKALPNCWTWSIATVAAATDALFVERRTRSTPPFGMIKKFNTERPA